MVTLIVVLVILALLSGLAFLASKHYKKVGPNQVLIIYGLKKRTLTKPDGTTVSVGYRTCVGGGTFVLPFLERAETLNLEVVTVPVRTPEVLSARGVPLIAEALAQVKIQTDEGSIHAAAEQFLGKGAEYIRDVAHTVLEGYMRAAIGKMTVEEIYQNRDDFARKVLEPAAEDLKRMGLTILSFSLKDLTDSQGYLDALGRPEVARVKAEAEVAQAEADRDATIKASEARKQGDRARIQAEAEIAAFRLEIEGKKAENQAKVNRIKAQTDLAYDLERYSLELKVRQAEYDVRIAEKQKAIELEEKEVLRKEKELEATVRKTADARKYQAQTEAQAEAARIKEEAKAKAEAQKLEGDAEAQKVEALGRAEAKATGEKLKALASQPETALAQMLLQAMPELARSVSEPLSKVDKIVMVGGSGENGPSKLTGQVAAVLAQLPEVVKALSGVDLRDLLQKKLGSKEDEGDRE